MEDNKSMKSDLLYLFKKLYERRKLTKAEYDEAIRKTITGNY